MNYSKNPGVGVTFDKYFDNTVPGNLVKEGEDGDVTYKIYEHKKDSKESSHFKVYVQFPTAYCTHSLEETLPPAPGHEGVNFGPTDDLWVGFGTLDSRDYNFHNDMSPFGDDLRETPGERIDFQPNHWTPDTLESATLNWIQSAKNQLNYDSCPYDFDSCDN